MSESAFGHGGFTGTAMWIDPELNLFVIFLSNRVHPNGKGSVNHLAGRIGTLAAAALNDEKAASVPNFQAGEVLTGIDILQRDRFEHLQGRKVGLITNHTGLNRDGERTVDLLNEAENVQLVSLFSPEHGLQASSIRRTLPTCGTKLRDCLFSACTVRLARRTSSTCET